MALLGDHVLDNGLAALKSGASHVFINSAEPATFTAASSTNKLGTKNFGAGNVFPAAIAAGSPNGRKVTTAAVTDGVVDSTGTASHWSICDVANTRLLATNSLSASQLVTAGNPFTLTAFDIRIPGA